MSRLALRILETGKRAYVICFGARTGSSLLCEHLTALGFGAPAEYFQEPLVLHNASASEYLFSCAASDPSPWFGFKLAWHQSNALVARLAAEGECAPEATMWSIYPGLRTILLFRRDKVLQAVSSWRASTTDVWHIRAGDRNDPGRPAYDFEALLTHYQSAVCEEWLWREQLGSLHVKPHGLTYEELYADRRSALQGVVDFLGECTIVELGEDPLAMMRDDRSDEIAQRFRADLRRPAHPSWEVWRSLAGPRTDRAA